ncbi:hypothetical protein DPMN_090825 [Dreissena polymorpha]|uniref:Uncharacterized protein n=1 Tax=Dreissena polymorpha TaxID=45954 RepID=A0A9D4R049_DREPO|nr:hypothetical protein DPMN_090825 [Dreissena polymorpha]
MINKSTPLYPNVELNVEPECRAITTFGLNVELNVELECRASSLFKNKFTTLFPNVELNVELECRAGTTFDNLSQLHEQSYLQAKQRVVRQKVPIGLQTYVEMTMLLYVKGA